MAPVPPRIPGPKRPPLLRGGGQSAGPRYAHQFQLGLLELECVRRFHERAAAVRRIQKIDARLGEIAELMRLHQEALADRPDGAGSAPQKTCHEARRRDRHVLRY